MTEPLMSPAEALEDLSDLLGEPIVRVTGQQGGHDDSTRDWLLATGDGRVVLLPADFSDQAWRGQLSRYFPGHHISNRSEQRAVVICCWFAAGLSHVG